MKQVVVITGASRGIGAATAKLLGSLDYSVCVNYRKNEQAASAVVQEIKELGGNAIALQADISVEADVVGLFESAESELGPITALVNNAGVLFAQTTVANLDAERINTLLQTNVTGTFICCREAVKRIAKSAGGSGGSIVNVSSVASRTGSPFEYVDYAASKGAVDTLTRGLSVEVAQEGIRVNCVRPGAIDTEMHADGGEPDRVQRVAEKLPLKRGGKPTEVANAVAWLLSDETSYCTGSFIDLSGGL